MTFTDKQRAEIKELYATGKNIYEIAEQLNIHHQSVKNSLKINTIPLGQRKLDKNKDEIIELYINGLGAKEIANKIGSSRGEIEKFLNKNNITMRKAKDYKKFKLHEDFFDSINTEEKAYILGFLYADGCNRKYRIAISIHKNDIDILNKMAKCVFRDGYLPNIKIYGNYANMGFNDVNFSEKLTKLGCVQRKSLILEWPEWLIDKDLQRHFIRGVFDGDGHISIWKSGNKNSKSKTSEAGITSTFKFCSSLKEIIGRETNIPIYIKDFHKTNSYGVIMGGNRKTIRFMEWLYKDATIYMNRKYEKYLDLKKIVNEIDIKISNGTQGYAKRYLDF